MSFVDAEEGTISLESHQEVKVLFKFISYREPVIVKEDNNKE